MGLGRFLNRHILSRFNVQLAQSSVLERQRAELGMNARLRTENAWLWQKLSGMKKDALAPR